MQSITMEEADGVHGAGFGSWGLGQIGSIAVRYVAEQVMAGNIDYSGLAASEGTYYNMVGA